MPAILRNTMKLYLSSYRIPDPGELEKLLGKPLAETRVALIPNAKDYYVERARNFKIADMTQYMGRLGLQVDTIDLRQFDDTEMLKSKLTPYDLIWAMGGNTYMLRYEMRRSGFDKIAHGLLEQGIIYGGDSAGALVAGQSIAGVEAADEPEFAEEIIKDGLGLIPHVILPHVDNPEFTGVLPTFRTLHQDKQIIELTDSQVAIFKDADTFSVI